MESQSAQEVNPQKDSPCGGIAKIVVEVLEKYIGKWGKPAII
jgi:hypothetical protein